VLFKVEIVVVVSHGHALSKRKTLRLRDLESVALALPTTDFATRQVANAAFTAAKIRPKVILETNDVEALFEVVRRGIAATLLPRQVAANVRDLSKIRLAERGMLQTAAFVWPRGGGLTPAAKRFLELADGIPKDASHKRQIISDTN
jgi:LysR family cyn operon transcriptional activator